MGNKIRFADDMRANVKVLVMSVTITFSLEMSLLSTDLRASFMD